MTKEDNADEEPSLKPQAKNATKIGCFLGLVLGPIITEIGLVAWCFLFEDKPSDTLIAPSVVALIFAWIPGLIIGPIVGASIGWMKRWIQEL